MCKCPYCNTDYLTWVETINHTKNCNSNNYTYAIHKELGPVHFSVFNSLTLPELKDRYGDSFVKYTIGKFKERGLISQNFKKIYSKEEILCLIQDFYNVNGRIPKGGDFTSAKGYPSSKTVVNKFGSWNAAILEAGYLPHNQTGGKKAKTTSKEDIISNIKTLAASIGSTPTITDYKKHYSGNEVFKVFGKWSIAVRESGLTPSPTTLYSKEYVIDTIKAALNSEESLTIREYINSASAVSPSVINRLFGSWNNALIESNLQVSQPSKQYGKPSTGLDGHRYLSKLEAAFCDKFLYQKFEYDIEPSYPQSSWRYDWYIPKLDLYIELYGGLRLHRLYEKIQTNELLERTLLIVTASDIKKYNSLDEIIYARKQINTNRL